MTINLFGYEKSVFNSDKFIYSNSRSLKEGTKTLESTLGLFCRIQTFSRENKFRLQPNAII